MNPASDQPVNELINISVQNEEPVTRLLRLMSVKSTNHTVILFFKCYLYKQLKVSVLIFSF